MNVTKLCHIANLGLSSSYHAVRWLHVKGYLTSKIHKASRILTLTKKGKEMQVLVKALHEKSMQDGLYD